MCTATSRQGACTSPANDQRPGQHAGDEQAAEFVRDGSQHDLIGVDFSRQVRVVVGFEVEDRTRWNRPPRSSIDRPSYRPAAGL